MFKILKAIRLSTSEKLRSRSAWVLTTMEIMGFDNGGLWVLTTVEIGVGFDNGGDWRGGDRWVSPSSLSHFLRYYMALSITHQIRALAKTPIPLET